MIQLHSFSVIFKNALAALAQTQDTAYLSLYDLFEEFRSDPKKYGYDAENLNVRCLVPNAPETPRTLCAKPDEHIYFDLDHASSAMYD